ncbi:hypothetical protein Xph01_04950 [Micromonospora phaseoli]|nr:hypothetical protein Xph01_04950 [Micromonospora phaseoli]
MLIKKFWSSPEIKLDQNFLINSSGLARGRRGGDLETRLGEGGEADWAALRNDRVGGAGDGVEQIA